ncbi:unnamed protein product, partial [Sphacelaria rigidula]
MEEPSVILSGAPHCLRRRENSGSGESGGVCPDIVDRTSRRFFTKTPQPNSNSGGISGNRERRPSQHSSVASVASDTGRGSFRSRREMMGTQLPITQRLTMRFKNTAVELSLAYTRSRCEMLLFTLVQTPLRCLR